MRSLVALSALVVCSCGVSIVSGNGTITSEQRTVPAFKEVEVGDAIEATLSTGARAVTITTDSNLQEYLEAVVEGDTLKLRVKPFTSFVGPTQLKAVVVNDVFEGLAASGAARIVAPATATNGFAVSASGASRVTVTGITSTSLSVDASGASTVTASGTASTGTLLASGASTVDVKGVPLPSANIDISGASTLRARVSVSLAGSVSGASNAQITGNPTNTVTVSGASVLNLNVP